MSDQLPIHFKAKHYMDVKAPYNVNTEKIIGILRETSRMNVTLITFVTQSVSFVSIGTQNWADESFRKALLKWVQDV